jgi:hypothetical protein
MQYKHRLYRVIIQTESIDRATGVGYAQLLYTVSHFKAKQQV